MMVRKTSLYRSDCDLLARLQNLEERRWGLLGVLEEAKHQVFSSEWLGDVRCVTSIPARHV